MPSHSDASYLKHRARVSRAASLAATDPSSRSAHRRLAQAYDGRAAAADAKALLLAAKPPTVCMD
jgi:hypothetical protein